MNRSIKVAGRRLRRDLEIVARKSSADLRSSAPWNQPKLNQSRYSERLIHDPISGNTLSLDQQDFAKLGAADMDSRDPLFAEAHAHALFVGASNRAASRPQNRWWQNPLYIRLPGFPADEIAKRLAKSCGWIFGPVPVSIGLSLFFITAVILFGKSAEVWTSMSALMTFQSQHWFIALAVLAITKVIHELAHATVCRRMGAVCRQIGVLFLCGTPCLYCDVSESWRIASPMRRASVMMAGIYVEWILATLAAWVWMLSEPSFTKMLAFHVMLVCGVSTFIFNINPLMKYDGYYVLSDLLNVVNLKQNAANAWRENILRPLAGIRRHQSGNAEKKLTSNKLATRLLFVSYHALSSVYRYVVLFALSSWMYFLSTRCGLEPLGRGLILLIALITIYGISVKWFKMWWGFGMWGNASWLRRTMIALTIALGAGLVLVTPFERRITTLGTVELANASTVFVPDESTVETVFAQFGDVVAKGEPLVQLHSTELELSLPELITQVRKLEDKLELIRSRAAVEPQLLDQILTTEAMLNAANQRLARAEQRIEKLQVVAPRDGVVLRPKPSKNAKPVLSQLSELQESMVTADSVWCIVGQPESKQVVMEVDASQRAQINHGSIVRISIDSHSANTFGGIIEAEVDGISLTISQTSIDPNISPNDRFEVTCRLPPETAARVPVGSTVQGVFRGSKVRPIELIYDYLVGNF